VRHLVSDRLYAVNDFWMARYKQRHYVNHLDQLQINHIVLAKVELDRFYEAITVRIYAQCYDYTADAQGKVIGGSKHTLRHYTEYWTFVRRIPAAPLKSLPPLNQCPQCGAAADNMGQAAECGYCGAKISSGDFSWVLFLILQDDVYTG
jgi:hypothetical protein